MDRRSLTILVVFFVVGCTGSRVIAPGTEAGIKEDSEVRADSAWDSAVDSNQCSYPGGPFGENVGDIVEGHGFVGFADPNFLCTAARNMKMDLTQSRTLSLKDFYCSAGCPAKKRKLLWLVVTSMSGFSLMAPTFSALQNDYAGGKIDSRVHLALALFEGDLQGKPPDAALTKSFINMAGPLTMPVVMDPQKKTPGYASATSWPTSLLIDLDSMKLVGSHVGGGWSWVAKEIAKHLDGTTSDAGVADGGS